MNKSLSAHYLGPPAGFFNVFCYFFLKIHFFIFNELRIFTTIRAKKIPGQPGFFV